MLNLDRNGSGPEFSVVTNNVIVIMQILNKMRCILEETRPGRDCVTNAILEQVKANAALARACVIGGDHERREIIITQSKKQDHESKHKGQFFPGRPVQSNTVSTSLETIQPYATINARRLLVHISATVYIQVLIYTAG